MAKLRTPTIAEIFNEDITHTASVPAIKNEFGDIRDIKKPEPSLIDELVSMTPGASSLLNVDDLCSADLETAERAITQLHSEIQSNTLLFSIAVHHLVENEVYKPEFQRPAEYFEVAPGRLKMSKSDFSYAYLVGSAWAKYHKPLLSAGFRPNGDTTKLRYIAKAAELHGDKDAIKQLPKMRTVEYIEWAKGERLLPSSVEMTHMDVKVEVGPKGILANDRLVVKMSDVQKIVESGGLPHVFGLDNEAEVKVVERALKEHRSSK